MFEETRRYGRRGIALHAISAADLALWDIRGKALGEPVHALLGGKQRDRVRAYASYLFGQTPEETAAKAREALELGLRAVKFGWGPFGVDEAADLAHVDAAREVLGGSAELMVDAGCAFDPETALARAKELARRDVRWLEEPLHYDDLEGYAWLCERSPVPIAGGEMETGVLDFTRLIDARVARAPARRRDLRRPHGGTGGLRARVRCRPAHRCARLQHRRLPDGVAALDGEPARRRARRVLPRPLAVRPRAGHDTAAGSKTATFRFRTLRASASSSIGR